MRNPQPPSYIQSNSSYGQGGFVSGPAISHTQLQPSFQTANISYNQPRVHMQPQMQPQGQFVSYGVNSYDRPPVVGQGGCCCSIM